MVETKTAQYVHMMILNCTLRKKETNEKIKKISRNQKM